MPSLLEHSNPMDQPPASEPTPSSHPGGRDAALGLAADFIADAYARLESAPSPLIAHPAQRELSLAIAQGLLTSTPVVAEAPTGTGKTLAYLVGALAATRATPTRKQIVVATATKTLQDQVLDGDLPKLVAAGVLERLDACVLKGGSNYFCPRDASAMLDAARDEEANPPLLEDDVFSPSNSETSLPVRALEQLLELHAQGKWAGDLDQVKGVEPRQLRGVAFNSSTCSRDKCPFSEECPLLKARKRAGESLIVVANQDLLLRDLHSKATGSPSVLESSGYYAVIDEAHHLPEKALGLGACAVEVGQLDETLAKVAALANAQEGSTTAMVLGHATQQLRHFNALLHELILAWPRSPGSAASDRSATFRFPAGSLPPALREAGSQLQAGLAAVSMEAESAAQACQKAAARDGLAAPVKAAALVSVRKWAALQSQIDECVQSIGRLCGGTKGVRWLALDGDDASAHYSPVEGAQVLRPLLWRNSNVQAALVSATLKGLDNFAQCGRSMGWPEHTRLLALKSTFDYSKSRIVVAGMAHSPKPHERREYLKELRAALRQRIDPNEGTLVILPSWAVLREVAPRLSLELPTGMAKVQGDGVLRSLIAQHKADVDAGRGSVLIGVASLAEGLDLPGAYCTHVCIAALPFAPPDSPLEEELAEVLGRQYFGRRSLPAATLVLTQQVGRLLRRASDSGTITVFDHRLGSTSYGREMLNSLPPFALVVEPRRASVR